jgi:acetyl-CoA synthetase
MTESDAFAEARDLLLRHREDYDAALREFTWPELGDFNWALDWFDVIAAEHPDRPALRILDDDGGDISLSYGEMSARSDQVANWLRGLGVRRGDRVLLMLGNVAPLWEVILATMKLGAVIIPASTLLRPDDLTDRVARGQVRHVITDDAQVAKFAGVPGDWTRIVVGEGAAGWHSYSGAFSAPSAEFVAEGVTRADDPLLLYFTSGTTAQPKLDVHLNLSSPGWAKHAWSNVFAPWNAGATVLVLNYQRFSAPSLLAALGRCAVTTFCAPPTVWRMLIQSDLAAADISGTRRGDLPGPFASAARADDGVPRRRRPERRGHAGRLLPHRRRRQLRRRRLHHLRRADRRRVQGLGLPDLAVRARIHPGRAEGLCPARLVLAGWAVAGAGAGHYGVLPGAGGTL